MSESEELGSSDDDEDVGTLNVVQNEETGFRTSFSIRSGVGMKALTPSAVVFSAPARDLG